MTSLRNLTTEPDYRVIITPQGGNPLALRKLSSINTRLFIGQGIGDCSIGIADADAEAYRIFDAMDEVTIDFKGLNGYFYRVFTGYLDSVSERFSVGSGTSVMLQGSTPQKLFNITSMTRDQMIQFSMMAARLQAQAPKSTQVLNELCDYVSFPKEKRLFAVRYDPPLRPLWQINIASGVNPSLGVAVRQAIAAVMQIVAENSSHKLFFDEFGVLHFQDIDFQRSGVIPFVADDLYVLSHDVTRTDAHFKSEIEVFGDPQFGGGGQNNFNKNNVDLVLASVVGAEVAQNAIKYRDRYMAVNANWLFQPEDIKRYAEFLMQLAINSAVQCQLVTTGWPEVSLDSMLQYPGVNKEFNVQAVNHQYTENQGFTTTFGLAYGRTIGQSIKVKSTPLEEIVNGYVGETPNMQVPTPGNRTTPLPTKPPAGTIPDSEGVDIYPLIRSAASKYGIPIIGLLAMLKAESGLNRTSARYGTFPDISFGMSQITVSTAAGYGIGNGSNDSSNIASVRDTLFDRETAINTGAHHLSGSYGQAQGDSLQALISYNSGSPQPEGNWYWRRYAANIENYRAALEFARTELT